MFGRSKRTGTQPLAPTPADQTGTDEPTLAGSALTEARDLVCETLDRLAEQVRFETITDLVLVLEDFAAELQAWDANHPDDPFGPQHIDGVSSAITKIRHS